MDDWGNAHRIVMSEGDADCACVHAYLHRAEGDLGNAGYWYRRAGHKSATGELKAEWAAIAATLLSKDANYRGLHSVPARPASFTTWPQRACSASMKTCSLSGGGLDCGTMPSASIFLRTTSSASTARNAS